MDKIIIIKYDTLAHIEHTLMQCLSWLKDDARYAHPNAHVKIIDINVRTGLSLIREDTEKFKDNSKIIGEMIEQLNKENV